MQRTGINPEIAQEMFDSARNAAAVGQSQFFTPLPFARTMAEGLPRTRHSIIDLNCGAGHLLHACCPDPEVQPNVYRNTDLGLFGLDIDPCRSPKLGRDGFNLTLYTRPIHRITADLTAAYPLFKEVAFEGDLFVLNPPYSLQWSRERLALLGESKLPAVRSAFNYSADPANMNPNSIMPKGCIDSSIASILIALDLCSRAGEGMAIVNNRTAERLIFAAGAPFGSLLEHIWARVVIEGNPMTDRTDCNFQHDEAAKYETAVIYFAASHTGGPMRDCECRPGDPRMPTAQAPPRYGRHGLTIHYGSEIRVADKWQAVHEELKARAAANQRPKFHVALGLDGLIQSNLSNFEGYSVKINKAEAARLHKLTGQQPMQLVMQRAGRDEVLHVIDKGGWSVEPALRAAITEAIRSYHAARAPLVPLRKIQRLGYLEEQDNIECIQNLCPRSSGSCPDILFHAGRTYPLRTQTACVIRTQKKPNAMTGDLETLEFKGEELATFLDIDGREYCFMDAKLMNDTHTAVADNRRMPRGARPMGPPIDFTLQQLCDHFVIPEVPDVATVHPEKFQASMAE